VRVDGEIVRWPPDAATVQCDSAKVETIEGMSVSARWRTCKRQLRTTQCAAVRLLHSRHADRGPGPAETREKVPSRDEIREHLSGSTAAAGYHAIVDAVEAVAQGGREEGSHE
jgi:aerobic-type carbon monoxide dehydrogenase small subunit (CoxS/CutS family)